MTNDQALLWQSRGVAETYISKALELLDCNASRGLSQETEGGSIVATAMTFLGLPYARTEELVINAIDCSTLISQSHWLGALLGVPFTSEGQRTAANAATIGDSMDLLPGDLAIKYPSAKESPGGRFNHVALIVGIDRDGNLWVIESSEDKEGCVLSTFEEFDPKGPYRRFSSNPALIFSGSHVRRALNAARYVPKLGRFGARQYRKSDESRLPHKGIDIYLPAGTLVIAPIAGRVVVEALPFEGCNALVIENKEQGRQVVMAHLADVEAVAGKLVRQGEPVGRVAEPATDSDIRYVDWPDGSTHLHFELRVRRNDEWRVENPLYAAKSGEVEVPFLE
jgi:murein DD-endopeptidase MepM/ murein hydrolase activator NlpD